MHENYCCFIYNQSFYSKEKLDKDFNTLKECLEKQGFIKVSDLCSVMGFESDNPYALYCGNKELWMKNLISELYVTKDDCIRKQIIKALHTEYED